MLAPGTPAKEWSSKLVALRLNGYTHGLQAPETVTSFERFWILLNALGIQRRAEKAAVPSFEATLFELRETPNL